MEGFLVSQKLLISAVPVYSLKWKIHGLSFLRGEITFIIMLLRS